MQTIGKVHKFSFAVLFLQALATWNPASAGDGNVADNRYFRLIVATCYTCHSGGAQGATAIPELTGLTEAQVKELLTAYKTDQQQATIMNRISKALTDNEIEHVSAMIAQTAK